MKKGEVVIGKRYNIDGEYRHVAKGTSDWSDDTPLYQYCTCKDCKTKLISWSKNATCPKCGRNCYLT